MSVFAVAQSPSLSARMYSLLYDSRVLLAAQLCSNGALSDGIERVAATARLKSFWYTRRR